MPVINTIREQNDAEFDEGITHENSESRSDTMQIQMMLIIQAQAAIAPAVREVQPPIVPLPLHSPPQLPQQLAQLLGFPEMRMRILHHAQYPFLAQAPPAPPPPQLPPPPQVPPPQIPPQVVDRTEAIASDHVNRSFDLIMNMYSNALRQEIQQMPNPDLVEREPGVRQRNQEGPGGLARGGGGVHQRMINRRMVFADSIDEQLSQRLARRFHLDAGARQRQRQNSGWPGARGRDRGRRGGRR